MSKRAKVLGADLVRFWGSAWGMGGSTKYSYEHACRSVLSAACSDWRAVDIRSLGVYDALRTFLGPGPIWRGSPRARIASTFPRAVRLYLEYLDDPDGWVPPGHDRLLSKREIERMRRGGFRKTAGRSARSGSNGAARKKASTMSASVLEVPRTSD